MQACYKQLTMKVCCKSLKFVTSYWWPPMPPQFPAWWSSHNLGPKDRDRLHWNQEQAEGRWQCVSLYQSGYQRGEVQAEEEYSSGRLSPPHLSLVTPSSVAKPATLHHLCGIYSELPQMEEIHSIMMQKPKTSTALYHGISRQTILLH